MFLIWFGSIQDGVTPIVVAAKAQQYEVVELLKTKYHQPEPTSAEIEALVSMIHVLSLLQFSFFSRPTSSNMHKNILSLGIYYLLFNININF